MRRRGERAHQAGERERGATDEGVAAIGGSVHHISLVEPMIHYARIGLDVDPVDTLELVQPNW
jgi:hypothetical protein